MIVLLLERFLVQREKYFWNYVSRKKLFLRANRLPTNAKRSAMEAQVACPGSKLLLSSAKKMDVDGVQTDLQWEAESVHWRKPQKIERAKNFWPGKVPEKPWDRGQNGVF